MPKLRMFLLAAAGAVGLQAAPAGAATCFGVCGSSTDPGFELGDVVPAPTGDGSYMWVSTMDAEPGRGRINRNGAPFNPNLPETETNGSELITNAFFAAAGDAVQFFFNYATTDGAEFADYAFAQLINRDTGGIVNLFTARTVPSGTTVPGRDLPDVEATLEPPSVPIMPGTGEENGASRGPVWGALTLDSGRCSDAGCGLTGWIRSTYAITADASYELRFGATNFEDESFASGLAFAGLLLAGNVIGDGSSASSPLLPDDIGPNGEFEFEFTVENDRQIVFIDPDVAIGYDYVLDAGSPNILSAIFPAVAGDTDGYELFTLGDVFIAAVQANTTFSFGSSGIAGFKLRDIEVEAGLDPTDETAFVTGLTFDVSGPTTVNMSQDPVSVFVAGPGAIPEPATWAMMLLGFGLIGATARRRRRTAPSS